MYVCTLSISHGIVPLRTPPMYVTQITSNLLVSHSLPSPPSAASRSSDDHVIYVADGDVVLESDTFDRPIEGDSVTFEWYTFDPVSSGFNLIGLFRF